jgi:Bacterial Ig domain
MLSGVANVRTRTNVVNGVGYVFAYNYTNLSQTVTFTWQSAPTAVKESKTGQSYSINGASWSDTFGPYEARIYIVNGGDSVSPPPPPPRQPLSVAFTNPTSGDTVSGTTSVTMSASGGSGYTYRLSVDGANVYTGTNPTFSWNTTSATNAQHTLTANVTDASGNTGSVSLTVTVSNTATLSPASFTASFTYPASAATVNGAQSIGMSTTADWATTKTFTLSVDGTQLTSQTFPTATTFWYTWDTTAIPDGPHTLQLAVTMNGQTATATLPVTVKNASFTASFTYPVSGAGVSGAQSIGMSTTADWATTKTFTLSVDGRPVTSQTFPTATTFWYTWDTTTLPNGAYTLQLAVTMNGQTATATLPVTVSNASAPPAMPALTVSFTSPAEGARLKGNSATIGMASSGASGGSTFTLATDNVIVFTTRTTGSTASYTWNTRGLATGSHQLSVTVTDGAGQTATALRTVRR